MLCRLIKWAVEVTYIKSGESSFIFPTKLDAEYLKIESPPTKLKTSD